VLCLVVVGKLCLVVENINYMFMRCAAVSTLHVVCRAPPAHADPRPCRDLAHRPVFSRSSQTSSGALPNSWPEVKQHAPQTYIVVLSDLWQPTADLPHHQL
jgi:hypothetical protein